MLDRLNSLSLKAEYKDWREEQLAFEKNQTLRRTRNYIYANERDLAFERITKLAKVLPHQKDLKYNDKVVKEHKNLIDAIVTIIACNNDDVGDSFYGFKHKVEVRKNELMKLNNERAKNEIEKLEKVENDFDAELGNLILKKAYYIQTQRKPRKKKYKVNDKGLKRQIRIEESKIRQAFKKLLSSFGQSVLFALNNAENEYTNTKSASDIEKEMKEGKQKELESQEYEEYLKEQQRKEFYNSYSK
ncbi:MAG: hypothetical protein KBS91_00915 [Firmicutes bacterium]|nr:hypothetical protein [Candidatus Caballimonas caccae]